MDWRSLASLFLGDFSQGPRKSNHATGAFYFSIWPVNVIPNRKYKKVPPHLHDHDLLPDVSEIPSILRRRRAVSVGPQSEADAYETLAYREKRRRRDGQISADINKSPAAGGHAKLEEYEQMMGTGSVHLPDADVPVPTSAARQSSEESDMEEPSAADLFARIAKPRVRYDVEVVTRLIVYSGE